MNVRIKFFGMIAEAAEKELLIFEDFPGETLGELENTLLERLPQLKRYSYSLALNKKLSDSKTKLEADNEVAVLPPFAGG
ncbi:MAG: MoaD/ThiS family protein [Schleiferiaceae bacterium]|jgi:molybdopterin synthase sulfur carrier subunit|nr:MoaD/ThiS family protein [Schleiferiaceae bacterium]